MTTQIKTWQIIDGDLTPIQTSLASQNRTEPYDLEQWIASNPETVGSDIAIIGRQVICKSGPLDLLGIDKQGNLVVIELKRDRVAREALAQAMDYASDVAEWSIDKIGEIASEYTEKTLEDAFADAFPDVDVENLNVNSTQRILLVGFSVEPALERMIQWLSDGFGVNINAVVLNYVRTANGDELLARTSIISEELEKERVQKKKKFQIPMSDAPGEYDSDTLRTLLVQYLRRPAVTNQRIRDVLLRVLLERRSVSREELKHDLVKHDPKIKPSKAGYYLTTMSTQLGMKKNDFLRQVVSYEYPSYSWEKDNFTLREDYRDLIRQVLAELGHNADSKK